MKLNPLFQLFLLVISILTCAPSLFSQSVNGRLTTSVYAWEKFDTVGTSEKLIRGFQTLQLEATHNKFSFHSSLVGATTIGETFGDDGNVRINNIFLRWKATDNFLNVNVGRIPVFAGVGVGTVDGALFKINFNSTFATVYGGRNVIPSLPTPSFQELDENFFLGGHIVNTTVEGMRVGVSYTNRTWERKQYFAIRTDSLFNPTSVLIEPGFRYQQLLGADVRYDCSSSYTVSARYDYDMNTKKNVRLRFGGRAAVMEKLSITADILRREPRIPFQSFFSMFPTNPITEYEGGVEYEVTPKLFTYGRYAFVKYVDENSSRISFGATSSYISINVALTDGYAGELSSLSAQGMYPLLERTVIPTIGFSYASYRLDEDAALETVFASSLGTIVRFSSAFSVDAQLQLLQNKVAENDVRLFAKVSYWFHHSHFHSEEKETNE
ncbi:MAG: hypothetical protein KGZ58_10380 [Ignavibacteriales bacterium]|nr:hypothetical protein [Ignavibacteriales bacterium]